MVLKTWQSLLLVIALVIGTMLARTALRSPSAPLTASQSPAELLASIDERDRVIEYAALLDAVEPKCIEDRLTIARLTIEYVQKANRNDVGTDNLDMLTGLSLATKDKSQAVNCAEIYAEAVAGADFP